MHELGLTQEIVDVVSQNCNGNRITRVVLEVGKLSMVMPDALRFCFGMCSEGTPAEGSELDIIEIPGRARCRACTAEIDLDMPYGECTCGSIDLEWLSGDEFRIKEIEIIS